MIDKAQSFSSWDDGLIPHMAKFNAYQRRQVLISFSSQTLSHTLIQPWPTRGPQSSIMWPFHSL
jgi:hypothetical protein